ncbi:LOW QUALITY PROTEIN: olfactory receptor 10G4-like [Bombina bombina]|uniref:LOW QUALITY PROTEIN: olfactory receptor 10G4-like n=1 Tax=Bombina bombina TaxID=8345 RepID=UPI00235AE956|nr:LOW QUALITY PROTEIN: olfactory receptor 10G4-like [Bombina bombina]
MEKRNSSTLTEFILQGLPHSKVLTIPLVLLFVFLYIFTLLGNILLLLIVKPTSALHTPMYFFLANLSFLDIFLSSVTLPKLLASLLSVKNIPFSGCVSQLYFFHFLASSECFLYTVMAYDRYVAICHPFLYTQHMNWKLYMGLGFGSWLTGSVHSMIHTILTFILPFCGPNEIEYFFCDIIPVLKLACADTTINKSMTLVNIGTIALICFIIILTSYINIILQAVMKIKTVDAKRKIFSTCGSHATVVLLFYIPCVFIYMRPDTGSSNDSTLAIFYTVITPFLNPIIYSLRHKEVKEAFKKLIWINTF